MRDTGPLKRPPDGCSPSVKPEQDRQEPWGQGHPVKPAELLTSGQLRIAVGNPREPKAGHTAPDPQRRRELGYRLRCNWALFGRRHTTISEGSQKMPIPTVKEIWELVKSGATLQAQEKVMELPQAVMDLQETNLALREELQSVKAELQATKTAFEATPLLPRCPRCGKLLVIEGKQTRQLHGCSRDVSPSL